MSQASSEPKVPIGGLHHFAYRCKDAEETRQFYEGLLGLPLACTVTSDIVPSTGEFCPYFHLFFEMQDGSYLAFFDLADGQASVPDPETPAWVNHIALEVKSLEALEKAKKQLQDAGVEVLGVTDHHFIQSIYFFDPNGIRLELTCRVGSDEMMAKKKAEARGELEKWTAKKKSLSTK